MPKFNPYAAVLQGMAQAPDDSLDKAESGNNKPDEDPCWEGYEAVGTKKKGRRTVPNCVPMQKGAFSFNGALYRPAIVNGELVLQNVKSSN